jgi:hypothetical protein
MKKKILAAGLIAAAAFTLTGCSPAYEGEATNCTVTDKQAVAMSKGGTNYRVFSSCGVFGVQDDLALGQWNSADTFNSIEVGKTYDFEAYGWRNGFFSTFPNILKATEVEA